MKSLSIAVVKHGAPISGDIDELGWLVGADGVLNRLLT